MNNRSSLLRTALEQLRLKLLDLTGRNRLLNFKHTAGKSLQFVEGDPHGIFQRLVEAVSKSNVSILGLPEPLRSDWIEINCVGDRVKVIFFLCKKVGVGEHKFS